MPPSSIPLGGASELFCLLLLYHPPLFCEVARTKAKTGQEKGSSQAQVFGPVVLPGAH